MRLQLEAETRAREAAEAAGVRCRSMHCLRRSLFGGSQVSANQASAHRDPPKLRLTRHLNHCTGKTPGSLGGFRAQAGSYAGATL